MPWKLLSVYFNQLSTYNYPFIEVFNIGILCVVQIVLARELEKKKKINKFINIGMKFGWIKYFQTHNSFHLFPYRAIKLYFVLVNSKLTSFITLNYR